MIDYSKIPIQEFSHLGNVSIFNYEIGIKTLNDKECIWKKFEYSGLEDDLQVLDNGTLIVSQNLFGGQTIISKYTCGLNFCYQLSNFLSKLDNYDSPFSVALGSDDYHSGWDYDFHLKIVSGKSSIKLIKDIDFLVEVDFDKKSFLLNYVAFSKKILRIFQSLYPEIVEHSLFIELEKSTTKLSNL